MASSVREIFYFNMEGIFAINKPSGPTSHDMVDQVRRATGIKKVGHAGTLDPLAHGVLVVAIGRQATRQLAEIVNKEKEYIAEIRLGVESTTDDAEGTKIERVFIEPSSLDTILAVKRAFVGKIAQIPPHYSAVHVQGRRAYELAREGQSIQLVPREVEVKLIDIISYTWPILTIRVVTGPGVYIRALARDIGNALGVGGYITDLQRTRVGDYRIADCMDIAELAQR